MERTLTAWKFIPKITGTGALPTITANTIDS
jgi:hypothetical protein